MMLLEQNKTKSTFMTDSVYTILKIMSNKTFLIFRERIGIKIDLMSKQRLIFLFPLPDNDSYNTSYFYVSLKNCNIIALWACWEESDEIERSAYKRRFEDTIKVVLPVPVHRRT